LDCNIFAACTSAICYCPQTPSSLLSKGAATPDYVAIHLDLLFQCKRYDKYVYVSQGNCQILSGLAHNIYSTPTISTNQNCNSQNALWLEKLSSLSKETNPSPSIGKNMASDYIFHKEPSLHQIHVRWLSKLWWVVNFSFQRIQSLLAVNSKYKCYVKTN